MSFTKTFECRIVTLATDRVVIDNISDTDSITYNITFMPIDVSLGLSPITINNLTKSQIEDLKSVMGLEPNESIVDKCIKLDLTINALPSE